MELLVRLRTIRKAGRELSSAFLIVLNLPRFGFSKKIYLYTDQFIFCSADSKLYGMSDTDLPVGIGPDLVKMIPGFVPMLFKLAVLNRGLSVYRVGTGYIQSYWVERGKHPHIRYNSSVIFPNGSRIEETHPQPG